MGDSAKAGSHRRIAKILLSVAITAGAIASISSMGLISCGGPAQPTPIRPLTAAEVQRLAGMRADNYREGRVGLRGTIGPLNQPTRVSGWIDWRRSLMYVALNGPTTGSATLLQATPAVLAIRAGPIPPATGPESATASSTGPNDGPQSATMPSADPSRAPESGMATSASAAAPTGTAATPSATGFDQPPLLPPADGWRVRPLSVGTPGSAPLDSLVSFLFLLARPTAEDAARLAPLRSQWIRSDTVQGTAVDVLLGPALPLIAPSPAAPAQTPAATPPAPSATAAGGTGGGTAATLAPTTSGTGGGIAVAVANATGSAQPSSPAQPGTGTAPADPAGSTGPSGPAPQSPAALDPQSLDAHGGGVGYWIDAQGRLHRTEVMLAAGQPAVIDLLRSERAEFRTIDALGGRTIAPRAVTDREANLLAKTRAQNLASRGGYLKITLPVRPDGLRQAEGWLDWRNSRVYLSVRDPQDATNDRLIFADRTGVASHRLEGPGPQAPPANPPRGGWDRMPWTTINKAAAGTDLDLLLSEVLSMTATRADDVAGVRAAARWLRVDLLHGVPVGVFELPAPAESQTAPPGLARLRYWIDNTGVLRRLELRTGTGGLAQLDVDPTRQPPALPTTVR